MDRVILIVGVLLLTGGCGLYCSYKFFNPSDRAGKFSLWPRDRYEARAVPFPALVPERATALRPPESRPDAVTGLPAALDRPARKVTRASSNSRRSVVAGRGSSQRDGGGRGASSPAVNNPAIPSNPTNAIPQTVKTAQRTVTRVRHVMGRLIPERVTYTVDDTATTARRTARGARRTVDQAAGGVNDRVNGVVNDAGASMQGISDGLPGLGGGEMSGLSGAAGGVSGLGAGLPNVGGLTPGG